MARIDAHLHVFAKADAQFPREVSDRLPAAREEPVEKLMEQMAAHGVDQAVLVQIGGARLEHHAYLQHCLKRYPGRFLGIGMIPDDASAPHEHMDRLAGEGGIVGFKLSRMGGPTDPLVPIDVRTLAAYPIWQHAAARDYVLWLYPRAVDAHLIPFLIDAFPQVRVVFNHLMVCPGAGRFTWDALGRPRIDTAMPPLTRYSTLGLHQYENVCVHLSGQYAFSTQPWPYRDSADWHRQLLRKFGDGRLMWASDFPWIVQDPGYGRLTTLLDELLPELTDPQRAQIMGGTAKRVLRFPDCA